MSAKHANQFKFHIEHHLRHIEELCEAFGYEVKPALVLCHKGGPEYSMSFINNSISNDNVVYHLKHMYKDQNTLRKKG